MLVTLKNNFALATTVAVGVAETMRSYMSTVPQMAKDFDLRATYQRAQALPYTALAILASRVNVDFQPEDGLSQQAQLIAIAAFNIFCSYINAEISSEDSYWLRCQKIALAIAAIVRGKAEAVFMRPVEEEVEDEEECIPAAAVPEETRPSAATFEEIQPSAATSEETRPTASEEPSMKVDDDEEEEPNHDGDDHHNQSGHGEPSNVEADYSS